jgi:hypothetical protein
MKHPDSFELLNKDNEKYLYKKKKNSEMEEYSITKVWN